MCEALLRSQVKDNINASKELQIGGRAKFPPSPVPVLHISQPYINRLGVGQIIPTQYYLSFPHFFQKIFNTWDFFEIINLYFISASTSKVVLQIQILLRLGNFYGSFRTKVIY